MPPESHDPTTASADIELGAEELIDVTDAELLADETGSPAHDVDPQDMVEELERVSQPGTEPVFSRPIPTTEAGAFDRVRGKPATIRPESGGSIAGSRVAYGILLQLHDLFEIQFPQANELSAQLVADCGMMLINRKWPDDANAREVILALLPLIAPAKFPQDGAWRTDDFPKLRSQFLTAASQHDKLGDVSKALRQEAVNHQATRRKRRS